MSPVVLSQFGLRSPLLHEPKNVHMQFSTNNSGLSWVTLCCHCISTDARGHLWTQGSTSSVPPVSSVVKGARTHWRDYISHLAWDASGTLRRSRRTFLGRRTSGPLCSAWRRGRTPMDGCSRAVILFTDIIWWRDITHKTHCLNC